MNDLWFDPNRWAWLPGTAFGVLGGVWGALVGVMAPRGKGKAGLVGSGLVLIGLAAGSLIAGLVGLWAGQPYGVWYGLILPGFIGLFVLGPMLPVVLLRYRQAEGRKIQAEDALL